LCGGTFMHNLSQSFGRFLRLLSAIEHAKQDARLAIDPIIHRVRKASREQAMEVEHLDVNPGVQLQRVDIGKERVEKIIAEASSLPSIESPPAVQILERRRQDLDFHSADHGTWLTRSWTSACSSGWRRICATPHASMFATLRKNVGC
jgi:hypothetical protein